MNEHQHGSMNITDHERVFEHFVKFAIWVAVIAILVLIFLAIFNS